MAREHLNILIAASAAPFKKTMREVGALLDKYGTKAETNFRRANRGAQRNYNLVNQLTRRVGALGAAYYALRSARWWVEQNDALIEMDNRLRLVTKSTEELVDARHRLYEVSQETRTALLGNIQFYAKLKLATRDMTYTDEQRIRVVQTLNKQIQIGGSNLAEANAGLIQFAQGLASGKLHGDELRSVLEQLQGVSVGLIQGFEMMYKQGELPFEITRANIRALAAEGEITTERIVAALLKVADETDDKFKSVAKTSAQAFVQINNESQTALRAFDNMMKATEGWLTILEKVRGVVGDIREAMQKATSADDIQTAMQMGQEGIRVRRAAIQTALDNDGMSFWGVTHGKTRDELIAEDRRLAMADRRLQFAADGSRSVTGPYERQLQYNQRAQLAEEQKRVGIEAADYTERVIKNEESTRTPTQIYEDEMSKLDRLAPHMNAERVSQGRSMVQAAYEANMDREEGRAVRFVKSYERGISLADQYAEKVAEIDELEQRGMLTAEQTGRVRAIGLARYNRLVEEAKRNAVREPIPGMDIGQYSERGRGVPEMPLNEQQLQAVKRYTEALQHMDTVMKNQTEQTFMDIVSGAKDVEDAFKDLASSIIAEMYRMTVARPIAEGLSNMFSTAFSAFFNWSPGMTAPTGGPQLVGIGGRASGGPVHAGVPYLVGEHGREIVVPSGGGRVMRHSESERVLRGDGMGGGGVNITQNLNFALGVRAEARDEINRMLPTIAETTKSALMDAKHRGEM